MKIVQINAVYGVGSTGTLVKDIHEYLKRNGHESFVFWAIKRQDSTNDKHIRRIGNLIDHKLHAILTKIFHNQGFHSNIATKRLCKRIKKINPDVIHLHNLHSNYINLTVLLDFISKNDYPLVLTLHDCWFFTGGCNHYIPYGCDKYKAGCLSCKAYPNADEIYGIKRDCFAKIKKLAIVGVSKWTMESAKGSILRDAPLFSYVYNWTDVTERRVGDKRECFDKYNIDGNKKVVLCVSQAWKTGGYKGEKDILYINEKISDFAQVVMVGKNIDLPLDSGIRYINYMDDRADLMDLYAHADVYLTASKYETFGLTMIEAMAMGTPVIAYKNTGAKEVVHESCGVLVEDGNKEELLKAVTTMLNADLNCYKARCKKWVNDNFSIEEQIKKYESIYYNAIELS